MGKRVLANAEEIILAITMISMVIINFGNVVSRYFLHQSWAFTEEILMIFFVYNSFLGASIAMKRGCHLGFTALVDRLPRPWRKAAVLFSTTTIILLMIILAYYGLGMCRNQFTFGQRTPALGIPEWLSGLSIPLAAFLISVRTIQFCFIQLKSLNNEGKAVKTKAKSACEGGQF